MSKPTPDVVDQEAKLKPDFLIIPHQLVFDNNLAPLDLKVFGVIYWFEKMKDGECWASNNTISKLVNSSAGGVQNSLARLERAGYIKRQIKPNNQHILQVLVSFTKVATPEGSSNEAVKGSSNDDHIKNNNNYIKYKADVEKIFTLYLVEFKIDKDAWQYAAAADERAAMVKEAYKKYKLTDKRKAKIISRLDDAGFEMLKKAIKNVAKSDFHRGNNDNGWSADLAEFICRSYEKVEEWANK